MARQFSIRNVPEELSRRIEALSEERGTSINSTVLSLLEQAVGIEARRKRLARYTTWSDEDLEAFRSALAAQRVIDPKVWK